MATKNLPGSLGAGPAANATAAGLTGSNVDLISNTKSYADLIGGDANSDLRSRLWSELVTRDAREKNVFAKFIGGEGSGKPRKFLLISFASISLILKLHAMIPPKALMGSHA